MMAAKYQTIHHVKAWIYVFSALNTMQGHCKTYVNGIFFFPSFLIYSKYLKMRDQVLYLFPCPHSSSLTWAYNRYSNNYLFRKSKKEGWREAAEEGGWSTEGEKKTRLKKGFFRKGCLTLNTPRYHRTSPQSQHPKIDKQELFLTIIVCNFVHFS